MIWPQVYSRQSGRVKGSIFFRTPTVWDKRRERLIGSYEMRENGEQDYIPPDWLSTVKWKIFNRWPWILRRWPDIHTWPEHRRKRR